MISTLSVFDRIAYKAKNEENSLTTEERSVLVDMCEEEFSCRLTGMSDEAILQHAISVGVIDTSMA